MTRRISGFLMIGGSFLMCALISAEKPAARQPQSARGVVMVEGPALYKAYCAVCHGKEAKGGGPMVKWLTVSPPDLTRIAVHNGGTFPLSRVQKIIASEEPIPGAHGTRSMPVWGPVFSEIVWDRDLGQVRVYNLARYLEGLQVKK